MKKLTVILALALMLSLATPAFAFVDVPEGHWAEEYLEKVVAAGIIEGFPDGTFRGGEGMTRYQAATVLARLMEWVHETTEEMMAEIDDLDQLEMDIKNLRSDLMVLMGEHFDLEFLVLQMEGDLEDMDEEIKALAAELDAQEEEIKAYIEQVRRALVADLQKRGLTDQQAEEVMVMIRALTREFADQEDVDELWAAVEALEEPTLSFSLDTTFSLQYYKQVRSTGVPYVNPFEHWDSTNWQWKPITITEGPAFSYGLDLGIHGRTDLADLDLTLEMTKDGLLEADDYLSFDSLVGTISTPVFDVSLFDAPGPWISPAGYILCRDRGAQITHDAGSLAFLFTPDDSVVIGHYTANPLELLTSEFIFGTINFDDQYVLGTKQTLTIDPVTLGVESAVSELGLDDDPVEWFVTAEAGLDLGMLSLGVDYTLGEEGFTPLCAGDAPAGGLGVNADALIGFLSLEAWYDDKHDLGDPTSGIDNKVGGAVALDEPLTFGPMALNANAEYTHDLEEEQMHYDLRDVVLSTETDFFAAAASYYHEKGPGRPTQRNWWLDCAPILPVPEQHFADVDLSFFPIDMLTLDAGARYNLRVGDPPQGRDLPMDARGGLTLTPIDWLSISANATYNLGAATDQLGASVSANITPDPYGLLGFDVQPSAGAYYNIIAGLYNYDVGLSLSREVVENVTWVTTGLYDYRQVNLFPGVGHPDGTWIKVTTGFDYAGIANVDFVWGDYTSISDPADDYGYKGIEASIGLSF